MIPMVDTTVWHRDIQAELEEAALDVLRSGRFLMGPNVVAFEQDAADYLGCQYAISCANGTDALVLALLAAGIGAGDEVITTSFTFFATAEAIVQAGAKPVFVDIDPNTFNLDPSRLESALTSATKAVLLVHLFGLPAAVQEVKAFCCDHNLLLVEDCAQSFGASVAGQQTGTFGSLGCFSFFPGKNLGGFGDGGIAITSDKNLANKLSQLRNHGSRKQYVHDLIGFNSRLDEIQAALLRIKLRHIDHYNQQRQQIAQWYARHLSEMKLSLPSGKGHVYHQYTVLLEKREQAQESLRKRQVASAIYYPVPLHQQKALKGIARSDVLEVTEKVCLNCLSLPVFPGMTEQQVAYIAQSLV